VLIKYPRAGIYALGFVSGTGRKKRQMKSSRLLFPLINAPRGITLRFMPALNVQEDEIINMLELLDASCADCI